MTLEAKDLNIGCLETDGFVPMLTCKDYSNRDLRCHDLKCGYCSEISETYRNLGIIDDIESLPEKQQRKLYGILCRSSHYPLQKDFLESGLRSAKQIIASDGRNCAYVGIRGSTSRGASTKDDDVDLFVIGENPKRLEEHAVEISNEEGRKLKIRHPETSRRENSLVVPVVIGDEYLDAFIKDPVSIDSDPTYAETMYMDMEKVYLLFEFLMQKVKREGILDNPIGDPFDFAIRAILPGRKVLGMEEKERTHNMLALLSRLYAIQVHGEVPQFKVTKLRDSYIFNMFEELL